MDIFIHNSVTATIVIHACRSNIISRVQQELFMFDLFDRISVVHTQIHIQLQIGRRLRDGGLITK